MIDKKIWPIVKQLISAVAEGDEPVVRELLIEGASAESVLSLFGMVGLELLLKTVLGRTRLALSRIIATDNNHKLYLEYVWLSAETDQSRYTFTESVTVRLMQQDGLWLIDEINPSMIDKWLTSPASRGVLSQIKKHNDGKVPNADWVLPLALMGGAIKLPFHKEAFSDPVEYLLVSGMQQRGYGLMALVGARRLWRDFAQDNKTDGVTAAVWAASAEFIMSEQANVQTTQAAIGDQYKVGIVQMMPIVHHIKEALSLQGLSLRYSPVLGPNIVIAEESKKLNGKKK